VGNTSHGDAHSLGYITGSEHDIQLARRDLGILIEGLVKINEEKEQDCIRILALDLQVLLADWADIIFGGHVLILRLLGERVKVQVWFAITIRLIGLPARGAHSRLKQ